MIPAQDISLCSIVPYREADQIGHPYQILNKDVDFTDTLRESCSENNTYYYVGLRDQTWIFVKKALEGKLSCHIFFSVLQITVWQNGV